MSKQTRNANKNVANVESRHVERDRDVGLPRIVARVWGLISGISYVSNGGYLLVQSGTDGKCQGAGAYMIVVGIVIIIMECACCICPGAKNNCCDKFETKFPFWARGLMYFVSVIPPLSLCFGVKTLISSIIVIMLALLYFFLTCLVRSNKYQRLEGAARQKYQEQKKNASYTYNAVTYTHNTLNQLKTNAAATKQAGRKSRPKKNKPRANANT